MVALTAPKKTMLFPDVVLKLAPEIVTVVPTGPDVGEKEWMTGCAEQRLFNERKNIHINGAFAKKVDSGFSWLFKVFF